MIDVNKLWKKRFRLYVKDMQRYLKLIFNDHFKFVLLFAIGGGAFYYQNWLKEVPANFPTALVIAIIIGFVLTGSSIVTFLKEADLVFLLPVETKLKPYFRRSLTLSYMFHSYILIFVVAALGPLYFHLPGKSIVEYLILTVIFLILKGFNLLMKWYVQYYPDWKSSWTDQIIRFALNFTIVYLLVSGANWIFTVVLLLIFACLLSYFSVVTKKKGLAWEHLIEIEAQRLMIFYRIANMFTDVPKVKERVKKRRWLNWVTSRLAFKRENAFSYLYYSTFTRSSDYLGIYFRLLVIGGLLLYFLPLGYIKLIVLVLFLYLSGFQLLTLFRHHSMKIWIDLYPISEEIKRNNFLKMLFELLVCQCFLFTIIIFFTRDFLLGFIAFGVGLLFIYLYVFTYVKNKLASGKD